MENVSINGLWEIQYATTKLRKSFWIIVFVFCNVFTAFYFYRLIFDYISQNRVTKVAYEESEDYSMPNVVFCTSRWYNITAMKRLGLSEDAIMLALSIFHRERHVTNLTDGQAELIEFMLANNFPSLTDFLIATSIYNSPDAFKLLDYASKEFLPLNNRAMTIFRDDDLTLCVEIVLGNLTREQVTALGEYSSRKLYISLADESNGMGQHDTNYIRMHSIKTQDMADSDLCIYLSLNRKHRISISPKTFHLKNGKCIENSDYNRFKCIDQCWDDFVKKNWLSGCLTLYHINHEVERAWGPRNITKFCHIKSKENLQLYNDAQYYCTMQCKSPCEIETYEIASSSSTLDMETNVRSMSIQFRLQVEHGVLTFRDVDTYTPDNLVANLGGVLGLFLGGNMFTLVQLCVWLWDYCVLKHKEVIAKRKRKKITYSEDLKTMPIMMTTTNLESSPLRQETSQTEIMTELLLRVDILERKINARKKSGAHKK